MFQENQQIGLYNLVKPIGRGGFGEVWLAERQTEILTTQFAIKLPHREQVNLEAIRQEAVLWAKASGHANILPIIEANIYDGQIVIVSEYAPDGSLEEKIEQELPINQTLEIVTGILNGLNFLHSRQIIHRDIKPANILQGETPRLADFGISRIIKTTALSASIVGTPKYMAPEAFDGKRSAATDIWSVGVILYQMLCGTVPFVRENPSELMWAIVSKEPEPMPESIPPELRRIVTKALAKLPENRYQTAKEMREDVQRALLNISHPTFARTEALNRPVQFIEDDAQTIDSKPAATNAPEYEIPPTEKFDGADKLSVATYFVPPTNNQNELQSTISTENNLVPPTASAFNHQSQEVPPTVLQVTETNNKQKRGFHWAFYLLPLFIDLPVRLIADYFNHISFFSPYPNSAALPTEILVYAILGAFFGYLFPQGKWKWGVLLNITVLSITVIFAPYDGKGTRIIYVLITMASACLSSYIASRLSLRTPKTSSPKVPEKWTTARIVRWVFSFLAPVIGFFSNIIIGGIAYRLVNSFADDFRPPHSAIVLAEIPILFVVFGVIGGLLGYFFPQQKWRWGLWLNLFNFIMIAQLYITRFSVGDYIGRGSDFYTGNFWDSPNLEAALEIIEFLTILIVPCIASYLGSRPSLRKS